MSDKDDKTYTNDRMEFLNGPVNDVYTYYHGLLDDIKAPEYIHEEYNHQFFDLLIQVFKTKDYIDLAKDIITEKYGEKECKEIFDIAIERLNQQYANSGVIEGKVRKKGDNIVMFPGTIWNEEK